MIPIVSELFQALLDGLGWVLAAIYDVIPNYGVSIIILTLLIRFLLFPLGMKQIKSMQHMQAIQPKIKEIQKKYKGNKPKAQEETMRLYKEAGVNPLGGCLPVVAQFPILISMYAVLRAPAYEAVKEGNTVVAYEVLDNHLPVDSALFAKTISHEDTGLVIVNLQCSASQAGTQAVVKDTNKQEVRNGLPLLEDGRRIDALTSQSIINCGNGPVAKIPYILLLGLMVGTTFFQQRQMQRSSPPGSASQQQQAIMKVMPLFFGFIGFTFPAGLVLYWTTSNFFQIGQQTFLLRAGHIGPEALDRRMAEQREKQANKPPEGKKGFMAGLLDRAEAERKDRGDRPTKGGSSSGGSSRGGSPRGGSSKGGSSPRGGTSGKGGSGRSSRGGSGSKGGKPSEGKRPRKPGSGGTDGQG